MASQRPKRFDSGRPGSYYCASYETLRHVDARIELIELWPCESKVELLQREQHHINNMPCVNKRNAIVDPEERLLMHRLSDRARYASRRDVILQKKRERLSAAATINCQCGGRYKTYRSAEHNHSKCHQRYLLTRQDGIQPDPLLVC